MRRWEGGSGLGLEEGQRYLAAGGHLSPPAHGRVEAPRVPWRGPRGNKVASSLWLPCVKEVRCGGRKSLILPRHLLCAQMPTVCTDAYNDTDAYCVHGCLLCAWMPTSMGPWRA